MAIVGVLVADPQSGTAIKVDSSQTQWGGLAGTTIPVRWPTGYTGRRLLTGEVEVLRAGEAVVTRAARSSSTSRRAATPPAKARSAPRTLIRKGAKQIEHRASVCCGAEELAVGCLDGRDRFARKLLTLGRNAQLARP